MISTFVLHASLENSSYFHHPLLQSKKKWLKRVYHTSTAFQSKEDLTHIKVVVVGGCFVDPDVKNHEKSPTCDPNTVFLDISKYISVMLLR